MGAKIQCAVLRNWKTTYSAMISAFFLYVLFSPQDFDRWPLIQHLAKFFATGGLVAFGLSSRDLKFGTNQEADTCQK